MTPSDITKNLRDYRATVGAIRTVTLVDPSRHEMLMEVMTPLVTAQIQAADIVAINKIDRVEAETVQRTIESARALNPRASIVAISAEDRTRLDTLMADLRC